MTNHRKNKGIKNSAKALRYETARSHQTRCREHGIGDLGAEAVGQRELLVEFLEVPDAVTAIDNPIPTFRSLSEAQEDKASFAAQAAKIPLAFCPPLNPFPNLIFQGAGGFECADKKFLFRAVLFSIVKCSFFHSKTSCINLHKPIQFHSPFRFAGTFLNTIPGRFIFCYEAASSAEKFG